MFINEGEAMPIGYGLVGISFERLGFEVLPIPICWIKRFWYWTIQKTKLFDWEKELSKRQLNTHRKLADVLDNLERTYIRAEVIDWATGEKRWKSVSLMDLIKNRQEKDVVKWIKERIFNP